MLFACRPGRCSAACPTARRRRRFLLLVQHDGGTLALAGALCALHGLAAAVGQPVLGRLVDQHGQTLVTGSATVLTTAALLALPAALDAGQPAVSWLPLLTDPGP
jgi:predicted MFS family arabinose efflux permease